MTGELVCELPTVRLHPLNSNGAFIELRGGRIMFAYNRSLYSPGVNPKSNISAVYSSDQGRRWTQPAPLLSSENSGALSVSSTSFVRMLDGNLGGFFTAQITRIDDLRMFLSVSSDEGRSWSEFKPCQPSPGYYVTNNDRILRLSSGRLLVPSAYHDISFDGESVNMTYDSTFNINFYGSCHFFYSDDDGATWRQSDNSVAINAARSSTGVQEPGVVEIHPGVIWGLGRTDLGRHYEFFSFDNGQTWTHAEPSRFTGPCSMLAIKRNPRDRSLIAVWNPVPSYVSQEYDQPHFKRSQLVYSISYDNGVSWEPPVFIENSDDGDFTHPAVYFTNDGVLFSYNTAFGQKVKRSSVRIRFVRYREL